MSFYCLAQFLFHLHIIHAHLLKNKDDFFLYILNKMLIKAELCEYQFERRFELEERRGLAYLGLKQYADAKTAFTTSISLLEDAAGFLPKKFVERKMQELKDNLKNCIYPRLESGGEVSRFSAMKRLPELKSRNRKFPALSDKVEVSQSSHQKRELFSTGEIGAGDILGIEKPVASVLEKVKIYCKFSLFYDTCFTMPTQAKKFNFFFIILKNISSSKLEFFYSTGDVGHFSW